MLQGVVSLLQHPQALLEHGQMILEGRQDSQAIIQSLLEPEKPQQSKSSIKPATVAPTTAAPTPVIESHGLW